MEINNKRSMENHWLIFVPKEGNPSKADVDYLNKVGKPQFGIICGAMIGKEFINKSDAETELKNLVRKVPEWLEGAAAYGVIPDSELKRVLIETSPTRK